MSSDEMSIKENTLQLTPQFHSNSASESESETKIESNQNWKVYDT